MTQPPSLSWQTSPPTAQPLFHVIAQFIPLNSFKTLVIRLARGPATLALALWLLVTSCAPKETKVLLQSNEALGAVLAEEAAHIAGAKKQIAIISVANWGPPSTAQKAFEAALKQKGYSIFTAKSADLGDPMRMRQGQVGLKSADFIEALRKSADAGAVVSFAGAPLLQPGDAARLTLAHPPVLVVATAMLGTVRGVRADPVQLGGLLDARIIQLAIIDGSPDSAAQSPGKPDATHQSFAQNYCILRSAN